MATLEEQVQQLAAHATTQREKELRREQRNQRIWKWLKIIALAIIAGAVVALILDIDSLLSTRLQIGNWFSVNRSAFTGGVIVFLLFIFGGYKWLR